MAVAFPVLSVLGGNIRERLGEVGAAEIRRGLIICVAAAVGGVEEED